ncbi:TetR/AcrR family transcriptional regulator [Massilia sp. METH4]|uniref:TetR/AcrR family transcriptional regulator n=1 Tax=Massilia sp. METH4 TaxID=3123041 RepID=UPI0030CA95BE
MRKKTEEKRQAILAAARQTFRESGFETSSMDDIAMRAGASKATVYGYFPSKEALFLEVILDVGEAHGDAAFKELIASENLSDGLRRFGEQHLAFISTPGAIALARLAITEGGRSGLGREFYARGPGAMIERLARYLEGASQRGQLRKCDPNQMAEHLISLYEAGLLIRCLFGYPLQLDEQRRDTSVARAVDVFMNFYGVPRDDAKPEW